MISMEYVSDSLTFIARHADKIPFLAIAANGMKVQLSYQRVVEALVIGAVLAGVGYIAVIPRLEERVALEIRQVRSDIQRLETRVEAIDKERQADYRELSSEVRRGQNGNRRNGGAK